MMKTPVRVLLILVLMAFLLVMACCTNLAERGTQAGGSPPVITHSFASEKLSHGDTWKIYVEAHDPDGDMRQFVCTVRRTGFGSRVDYVHVRKGDRAKMLGYLNVFVSPPQDALGEWADLTLTLYIRDRGGNPSEKVAFPVALSRGVKQALPPPPFDIEGLKGLGQIWVKLHVPRGGP